MSMQLATDLWLGIDGGGTKCSALIVDNNGAELGRGISGSANAYQNLEQTQHSILTATHAALRVAGLPESAINKLIAGVGLAGVNVPSVFTAMNQWSHPFKKMHLTTDLHIACVGAHNSNQGAVIIAGTGSCGYSFVNNQSIIVGGHGFLLGDKGSGAWMGLAAVKASLLAEDNVGPQTLLKDFIGDYLQASGAMIIDKLASATSSDYAKLSRFVFVAAQQNDEVALGIIRSGANYLSAIAEKLWQTNPGRMSLIGGLSEYIQPWLTPGVIKNLSLPINQPEVGAIFFAKQKELV